MFNRKDLKAFLQVGRLAFDLQVPAAFIYCAAVFAKHRVNIELCCAIFDFAEVIQDAHLMHCCIQTIQNAAPHIFQTEGFLACTAALLEVILKQDTIYNVTELQLFQACLAWSNSKPNEVESRKAALRPSLPLIRYRLFSSVDFAKHVCSTGLLSAEQERDILRSFVTGEVDFMPEGFSKATESRDSSQLKVLKIPSSGDRHANPKFVSTSLDIHVNKEVFIHGIKLLAFHSNLPDGHLYEENVSIELHVGNIVGKASFHGQVKKGEVITIKFDLPLELHTGSRLLIRYATCRKECVAYDSYKASNFKYSSGLEIRFKKSFAGPPELHLIVGDKVSA
ncbi:hypothetical protein B566_EDAN014530 [Ephemera danica]|nr:hypothetical protein B566_EDAN014530 [Ephemera danica]